MAASPDEPDPTDDIRPEYDFRSLRGAVRGKYAARYHERLRVVRLEPDVSAPFAEAFSIGAASLEYIGRNLNKNDR